MYTSSCETCSCTWLRKCSPVVKCPFPLVSHSRTYGCGRRATEDSAETPLHLQAADQLADSDTVREICAAQRKRILALKGVFPDEANDSDNTTHASVTESASSNNGSGDGGLRVPATGGAADTVAQLPEALAAAPADRGGLGGATGPAYFSNHRCSARLWLDQV